MDTSGRPHEGWMTVVPVTVFLFIVIVALGGPTSFANTLGAWCTDVVSAAVRWLRQF